MLHLESINFYHHCSSVPIFSDLITHVKNIMTKDEIKSLLPSRLFSASNHKMCDLLFIYFLIQKSQQGNQFCSSIYVFAHIVVYMTIPLWHYFSPPAQSGESKYISQSLTDGICTLREQDSLILLLAYIISKSWFLFSRRQFTQTSMQL